jgi:hypothetical protein
MSGTVAGHGHFFGRSRNGAVVSAEIMEELSGPGALQQTKHPKRGCPGEGDAIPAEGVNRRGFLPEMVSGKMEPFRSHHKPSGRPKTEMDLKQQEWRNPGGALATFVASGFWVGCRPVGLRCGCGVSCLRRADFRDPERLPGLIHCPCEIVFAPMRPSALEKLIQVEPLPIRRSNPFRDGCDLFCPNPPKPAESM